MNTKYRTRIVLIVLSVFFIPGILLVVFSALDVVVSLDPRITDEPYRAEFEATGRLGKAGNYTIETFKGAGGWEMVVNPGNHSIPLDDEGRVRGTDGFTIFWIFMKNPVTNTVQRATKDYRETVIDSLNMLGGGVDARYTIKVIEPFILWSPIHQSQASYYMGIYDEHGLEVATATIDATCGLLFELVTHKDGAGRLSLLSTDFPISRNRYFQAQAAAAVGLILLAGFLFRYFRAPEGKKAIRTLEMKFGAWGVIAVYVDIYPDVWWPFAFGTFGLIGLHLIALAPGAIWFRWWILPGILEILWAAFFSAQTGLMIPQLTHCPGILIAWMITTLFYRPRTLEPPG